MGFNAEVALKSFNGQTRMLTLTTGNKVVAYSLNIDLLTCKADDGFAISRQLPQRQAFINSSSSMKYYRFRIAILSMATMTKLKQTKTAADKCSSVRPMAYMKIAESNSHVEFYYAL